VAVVVAHAVAVEGDALAEHAGLTLGVVVGDEVASCVVPAPVVATVALKRFQVGITVPLSDRPASAVRLDSRK